MANSTPPAAPSAVELLPCPFCGTNPYLYTRDGNDVFIAVRCNGCGATSADFRNDPSNPDEFTGEPDAIAAWNRRTPPQAQDTPQVDLSDDQLDAMIRALDRYARDKLGTEGGLPTWDEDCFIVMRHHMRKSTTPEPTR